MSLRQRRTEQQLQSERGVAQFRDAILDTVQWVPDPVASDYGEDLLVRVVDDGVFSQLSFFVQHKTSKRLPENPAPGEIYWDLEVKDLLHWEGMVPPVYLVVWDVCRCRGWWSSIAEIQKRLDVSIPSWRTQHTARTVLPLNNTVDREGLKVLRRGLADTVAPLVGLGKPREIRASIKIPNITPEDRDAAAQLRRTIETGATSVLPGRYVSLHAAEWMRRLHGPDHYSSVESVTISSAVGDQPIPVRLQAIENGQTTGEVPYLELRSVQCGTREITISNAHKQDPLTINIVGRFTGFSTLTISGTIAGRSTAESLALWHFFGALARGCEIRMHMLAEHEEEITMKVPEGSMPLPPENFPAFIKQLCELERYHRCRFSLADAWPLTANDHANFRIAHDALQLGHATLPPGYLFT